MSNPTTLVEQFDDSLGDFSGVDPIRFDDGLWLEEATTNLCRYPIAGDGSVTGWEAVRADLTNPSADRIRVTRNSASTDMRMMTAGNTTASPPVSAGDTVTITVEIPATSSGQVVSGRFQWYDGANGGGSALSTTSPVAGSQLDDGRWMFSAVAPSSTASARVGFTVTGTQVVGEWVEFRLCQIEIGTYPTSHADYTMGDGYGGSLGSHSTRAASSASISPAGILSPVSGAIAARITPTIETGLEEIWGECGTKGTGTDHIQWGRDATKHPFVEWSANNAAYQRLTATETVDADTEHFFYFGHDGTATSLQVDAGTLQTGTRAAVSASFGAGELTLQASAGGVIVSPFATFDRLLTDTEIATLAARQGWSMSTLDSTTRRIRAQFELRPAY